MRFLARALFTSLAYHGGIRSTTLNPRGGSRSDIDESLRIHIFGPLETGRDASMRACIVKKNTFIKTKGLFLNLYPNPVKSTVPRKLDKVGLRRIYVKWQGTIGDFVTRIVSTANDQNEKHTRILIPDRIISGLSCESSRFRFFGSKICPFEFWCKTHVCVSNDALIIK